jgi:hypothetical protein
MRINSVWAFTKPPLGLLKWVAGQIRPPSPPVLFVDSRSPTSRFWRSPRHHGKSCQSQRKRRQPPFIWLQAGIRKGTRNPQKGPASRKTEDYWCIAFGRTLLLNNKEVPATERPRAFGQKRKLQSTLQPGRSLCSTDLQRVRSRLKHVVLKRTGQIGSRKS